MDLRRLFLGLVLLVIKKVFVKNSINSWTLHRTLKIPLIVARNIKLHIIWQKKSSLMPEMRRTSNYSRIYCAFVNIDITHKKHNTPGKLLFLSVSVCKKLFFSSCLCYRQTLYSGFTAFKKIYKHNHSLVIK